MAKKSNLNGKELHGAFHESEDDKSLFLCEACKDDEGIFFRGADELPNFMIDNKPLRGFITEVAVK